jgi:hypothetical protein
MDVWIAVGMAVIIIVLAIMDARLARINRALEFALNEIKRQTETRE